MPKWALTATSRTGKKVNPLGGDSDTVTVYTKADLDRRLQVAKTDPRDLDVTVTEIK